MASGRVPKTVSIFTKSLKFPEIKRSPFFHTTRPKHTKSRHCREPNHPMAEYLRRQTGAGEQRFAMGRGESNSAPTGYTVWRLSHGPGRVHPQPPRLANAAPLRRVGIAP